MTNQNINCPHCNFPSYTWDRSDIWEEESRCSSCNNIFIINYDDEKLVCRTKKDNLAERIRIKDEQVVSSLRHAKQLKKELRNLEDELSSLIKEKRANDPTQAPGYLKPMFNELSPEVGRLVHGECVKKQRG